MVFVDERRMYVNIFFNFPLCFNGGDFPALCVSSLRFVWYFGYMRNCIIFFSYLGMFGRRKTGFELRCDWRNVASWEIGKSEGRAMRQFFHWMESGSVVTKHIIVWHLVAEEQGVGWCLGTASQQQQQHHYLKRE